MKKLYSLLFLISGWSVVFSQTITVSTNQLDIFSSIGNTPSSVKSFTVQGINLTGNVFIPTADPALFGSFECSLTESPFVSQNIYLTPVAGIVPPTTIYVRLHSNHHGSVWDGIAISSTGAQTKYIECTGFVLEAEPTVQSTISFGAITNNSIVVYMNGGNGDERILLARESAPVNAEPVDGQSYPWSPIGVFGTAALSLGNGNYSVHVGQSHSVTVTALTPGRTYHFAVFEFNRAYWSYPPNPEAEGSQNYLLFPSTGSQSTFGNPLPITINYITGKKQNGNHLLNWKVTCISTPRVTMSLERSADSRNFSAINSITADAVRCDQPFDYTDTDPLKGMNYYRLKMTDADGKVTYSTIVALLNAVKGYDIISIAPNPVVANHFKLNIASAQAGKMDISIFDMQGRLVNRQSSAVMAGFNSLLVQVDDLSAGTYTIRGNMAGEQSKILRFVKQ